jgi:hypothetical protein
VTTPFNTNEFMKLLSGLEKRDIPFTIEHNRTADHCDGILVRIKTALAILEVGFYDYDHIEVGRFDFSGDVQPTSTESVLCELDKLLNSYGPSTPP